MSIFAYWYRIIDVFFFCLSWLNWLWRESALAHPVPTSKFCAHNAKINPMQLVSQHTVCLWWGSTSTSQMLCICILVGKGAKLHQPWVHDIRDGQTVMLICMHGMVFPLHKTVIYHSHSYSIISAHRPSSILFIFNKDAILELPYQDAEMSCKPKAPKNSRDLALLVSQT